MIDYEKERAALGSLVTVTAFKAWLEGLRKRTDAPGLRTGIDRWIERVGKMDPAKSLATVKGEIGNLYGIGLNLLNQAAGKPTEYGAAWADELLPSVDDFKSMWDRAQVLWKAPAEQNPEKFRPEAEKYVNAMSETRKILNAWKPFVKTPADAARYNRIAVEWAGMQEQFKRGAEATGIAPLLIVGGIALFSAGLAWAIAYWEKAGALKVRAQAELEDVRSRDAASREGRVVAPSTLPPPPADGGELPSWVMPVAGLAVAGGAAWWFLGRRNDREGEG